MTFSWQTKHLLFLLTLLLQNTIPKLFCAAVTPKPGFHFHKNGPAHKAILEFNIEKVRSLIAQNDPSLSTQNRAGELPIHLAARIGFQGGVHELLEFHSENDAFGPVAQSDQATREAKEQNTAAHIAAAQDNESIMQLFFDTYPQRTLRERNFHGNTVLHIAAREGSIHTLRQILKSDELKSDEGDLSKLEDFVNQQNTNGLTALHLACREGKALVVAMLLRTKVVDLSITSKNGLTALDMAQRNLRRIRGKREHEAAGFRSIIRLIKKVQQAEEKPEEEDDDEGGDDQPGDETAEQEEAPETTVQVTVRARTTTALHDATKAGPGNMAGVKAILEGKPENLHLLSTKDAAGNTPLHKAAQLALPGIVKYYVQLLRSNNLTTIITLQNDAGKTAQQLAQESTGQRKQETIDAFN